MLETLGRSAEELARERLVFPGAFGVSCVETGGAGRRGVRRPGHHRHGGQLNRLGILEEPWDVVVYDVLGDVVCGGFAVPMRKHFVDRVYLITSADFMALYAANNIMRGVARYSGAAPLLGRLIQKPQPRSGRGCLGTLFCQSNPGVRVVGILPEDRQLRKSGLSAYRNAPSGAGRGGGHALSGTGPAALGYPAHQPPGH
ncbi:MAG: nitrogenase iron protein, partial [Dysosmobacter sp.]